MQRPGGSGEAVYGRGRLNAREGGQAWAGEATLMGKRSSMGGRGRAHLKARRRRERPGAYEGGRAWAGKPERGPRSEGAGGGGGWSPRVQEEGGVNKDTCQTYLQS